jgi:hypothetical protein
MATSTTVAVWRSTGGDQTRTAQAGSMVMAAPFFIANLAATANVLNVSGGSALILPAGAVVTEVIISSVGTGRADIGFTPLVSVGPGQNTTLGTNVPQALVANTSMASRTVFITGGSGAGASIGNVANATNLVVITSAANGTSSGTVSGRILYHVADAGEENA